MRDNAARKKRSGLSGLQTSAASNSCDMNVQCWLRSGAVATQSVDANIPAWGRFSTGH